MKEPIKQSNPIRKLDRQVSHQIEYIEECSDATLSQQQIVLYEDKDEIDNEFNMDQALKEA